MQPEVEAIQADIDAAQAIYDTIPLYAMGQVKARACHALVQAFARHRATALAELSAKLVDVEGEREAALETVRRVQASVRTLEYAGAQELQTLRAKATDDYRATKSLDSEREMNAVLTDELATATARIAEMEGALRELRGYGCPVCSGDCAGANPPVMTCPMQRVDQALGRAS